MHKLEERVYKELEKIAEKGLTSSNLDTTYKLIDIYKDIKEACYYESRTKKYEDWDEEKEEHFLSEGSEEDINKIMDYIDKLIYEIYNYTNTREEKNIIKRHIDKLKSM